MHFFNNVACVVYDHIMEKYDRRDVQGDLQAIQYRMQELWVGDGGIMPNLYSYILPMLDNTWMKDTIANFNTQMGTIGNLVVWIFE